MGFPAQESLVRHSEHVEPADYGYAGSRRRRKERFIVIKIVRVCIALAVSSIATLSALGQLRDQTAEPVSAGSSLSWSLGIEHGGTTLTVSRPDGIVVRKEFAAGETPTFESAGKGEILPDGNYTWELVIAPRTLHTRDEAASEKTAPGGTPERRIVSGTFVVEAGAVRVPREVAERAPVASAELVATPEDQVIPDDLIVQGSGCFGFDCVNNESFGFDTIRLKENNLRIKFEDTSTGAFPSNDWQLTANDSASGGANKFSIEDITGAKVPFTVTAGAATNSIFVDSTGRVGFRTATPVLDLHVNTSNTPAMRLEQNNSGGFTAQTWDIAGNEANFFIRDVTGGSRLPFRIRPGAPTSSIDISASGDVGVGLASPSEKLHVFENVDANTFAMVENPNTGLSAASVIRAKTDTATVNFQAHASTRTISRFGKTLGGFGELLGVAGNGFIVGTLGNTPLVLGTNSTNRLEIGGSGGVTVTGNFTVTGGTKNFAVVDPDDSSKAIYFAALEGPEAGTYYRGSARTVDGEAVIELPGHFTRVTEQQRITVQLTPVGSWGQLYVAEKGSGRLVVRTAPGTPDLEFDYLVQGVRRGYLDYKVERRNELPE